MPTHHLEKRIQGRDNVTQVLPETVMFSKIGGLMGDGPGVPIPWKPCATSRLVPLGLVRELLALTLQLQHAHALTHQAIDAKNEHGGELNEVKHARTGREAVSLPTRPYKSRPAQRRSAILPEGIVLSVCAFMEYISTTTQPYIL